MPLMHPPHSSAQVNVNDDDVKGYEQAGWTKASSGAKKAAPSGGSSSKSSGKK